MAPEGDEMMTDTGASDEDMQAWLSQLEADNATYDLSRILPPINPATEGQQVGDHHGDPTGQAGDEPDPDDEEEEEPEPGSGAPAGTPPGEEGSDDDHFIINGEKWPRAEIERLYNFDRYLRANPDAAQRVAQAVQPPASGQPPVPASQAGTSPPGAPAGEPPAPVEDEFKPPDPPDYLDLEDPAQRFQWDTHVATEKRFFDQEQANKKAFAAQAAERQAQVNRQAQADMETALTTFKQQFPNLNDDDISAIRQGAVPLVEGMMRTLPPVQALTRSMEAAAWMLPDLHEKLRDPTKTTPTAHQRSTRRKQKLGQVGGSPRSAPKTTADRVSYTSDRDMVNALAKEFAEQGFGSNP